VGVFSYTTASRLSNSGENVKPTQQSGLFGDASALLVSPHRSLLSLIEIAHELGDESIERDAQALAERVADKRFFVACLGQFKRGKSSLLNALVGRAVLPTGVLPVTAIVTILRHGPVLRAEVHYENGSRQQVPADAISDFVSEERNPANSKGVAAVEVFVPCTLLESGMCFVDTPGIGSVFAGNTSVTKAFVPHIDAVLAVFGADPPISGDELTLIEEVCRQVDEFVFVLNKADRLTESESRQATDFARRILTEKIERRVHCIFQISASQWLNGTGPSRDAQELQSELQRIAREAGPRLVETAERRGRRRLAENVLLEIDAQRRALLSPIESAQRLAEQLRETITDAERSLSDLGHLFRAEQERVSLRCQEQRDRFLSEAIPAAREEFHTAIIASRLSRGAALRDQATKIAQQISRRLLDQWLAHERPAAEAMYRESARRFVDLANSFLTRLASSGDPALANLPQSISSDSGFRVKGKLYYGEHFGFPRESLAGWLQTMIHSHAYQIQRLEYQIVRYLDTLLTLNSTRILNDFEELVRESARRLEAEIRGLLKNVHDAALRRLVKAQETKNAGVEAVTTEVARIGSLRIRTLDLIADLQQTTT
jgi:GTP-binding protein EngB required for normal cell division